MSISEDLTELRSDVRNLTDRLFGEETVDPGILIRMDGRLAALERNPFVLAGQSARHFIAVVTAFGAVAFAAVNFQQFLAAIKAALH